MRDEAKPQAGRGTSRAARRVVARAFLATAALAAALCGACGRSSGGAAEAGGAAAIATPVRDAAPAARATPPSADGDRGLMGPPVLPPLAAEPHDAGPAPEPPAPPAPPPPDADAAPRYDVPLGDSPWRGARRPLAVLIAFLDIECPYSARVAPVLDQLVERHGDDLRVVYKALPLSMHPHAALAARAAAAARPQGRFWELLDLLFAHREHLERADLARYAGAAGLDSATFRAALDGDAAAADVAADTALGGRFGISGTPSFVLNGRLIVGARTYETFEPEVLAAIAEGRALLDRGVPRDAVYTRLVAGGLAAAAPARPRTPAIPPATPSPAAPAPPVRDVRVEAWNPAVGTGPVTLVVFGEYLCPFCARLETTLDALQDAYPGRLRIVYRTLVVHAGAEMLARAALAAHRQGKFRELHRLLFAHQDELRTDPAGTLDRVAASAGLDVPRLHRDMDGDDIRRLVAADVAEAQRVGVTGTPATFVDGHLVSGSQPVDVFRPLVDAALGRR